MPQTERPAVFIYESTFRGRGADWAREMFESPPCKPFAEPGVLVAVCGPDGVWAIPEED